MGSKSVCRYSILKVNNLNVNNIYIKNKNEPKKIIKWRMNL